MGFILPVITAIILLYAHFQSRKTLRKSLTGHYLHKLNRSFYVIGILCCLIAVFLLNAAIINWNEEIALLAPITVFIFLVMAFVLLMGYYNYRVVFDDRRIQVTTWTGKRRSITWSSIEHIKYHSTLGYVKLVTNQQNTVVYIHTTGFIEFLKYMELKTTFKAEELKIPFKL